MSTKTRYVLRSEEVILSWRRTFKKLISESEKKFRKTTLSVTLSWNPSLVLAILVEVTLETLLW